MGCIVFDPDLRSKTSEKCEFFKGPRTLKIVLSLQREHSFHFYAQIPTSEEHESKISGLGDHLRAFWLLFWLCLGPGGFQEAPGGSPRLPRRTWRLPEASRDPRLRPGWLARGARRLREYARRVVNGTLPRAQGEDNRRGNKQRMTYGLET